MTTKDWMSENLHHLITPNIWQPSSPDLNPLDYYVWGVVELDTKKHPQSTFDSLGEAITRVMTHMDENNFIRAYKHFWQRIKTVIAAEDDFIADE